MNEARKQFAAVALSDGIYALGGFNGKTIMNSVEKYVFFILILF